jgi:hypothetical protein
MMFKIAFVFPLLSGLFAPGNLAMADRQNRLSLRGMFLDSIAANQNERL